MPSKKLRILIFYTKVGGGHESLAIGLRERLEKHFPEASTRLVDPFTAIGAPAYQLSAIVSPRFYNLFYRFTQKTLAQKLISRINYFLHEDKIRSVLSRYKPDFILSTHFLFNSEVKEVIRKNHRRDIPVAIYVADPLTPHPVWFTKATDLILTYDTQHLPDLTSLGITEQRIIPIGMPVRLEFYQDYDRVKTMQSLGFAPEKFTVIFGGSGLGMDQLERLAKPISDLNLDIQGIFLPGRNTLLAKALRLLFADRPHFRIFDYVSDRRMAEIMQASDLFVGKGGPNIMFECIISNLPLIMTPPILGQERGNRQFCRQERIGFTTKNTRETLTLLRRVIKKPSLLEDCKVNLRRIRSRALAREAEGFQRFTTWIEEHL